MKRIDISCRFGFQGFTLLELVLIITIVSLLGVVLLEQLLRYWEMAEKAAMEQLIGTLQSAMVMRMSTLVVRHQAQQIPAMPQENPMGWLSEKPTNYLGEYYHPESSALSLGSWYYDIKDQELIYLVNHGRYFIPGTDGRRWIRFKVGLVYSDIQSDADRVSGTKPTIQAVNGGNRDNEAGKGEVAGVVLNPINPYQWF
ncbi:conserved hypothetical protein [Gammaproteobacteria bacterium]